jgi:hypothetical protein
MEDSIPKRVFTFVETKPSEKIYEICIALNDVRGAVELKCFAAGDEICEFEIKPKI